MVNKDEMQISYVQEKRTADAIFVVHRMQRKYSALKKILYFVFKSKSFPPCAQFGLVLSPEELFCWFDKRVHLPGSKHEIRWNACTGHKIPPVDL